MEAKVTIPALAQMKREGKKSVGVVAWDYQIGRIADRGVLPPKAKQSDRITFLGTCTTLSRLETHRVRSGRDLEEESHRTIVPGEGVVPKDLWRSQCEFSR